MEGNLGGVAGEGGHSHPSPLATGGGEEERKCEFNRNGYCQRHFSKGQKVKIKKWGLKKNNIYGWVVRTKYRCMDQEFSPIPETGSQTVQLDAKPVHTLRPAGGRNITWGLDRAEFQGKDLAD